MHIYLDIYIYMSHTYIRMYLHMHVDPSDVYMCSSYACVRTYIHKYMQACTSIYTHICASVREDLCT